MSNNCVTLADYILELERRDRASHRTSQQPGYYPTKEQYFSGDQGAVSGNVGFDSNTTGKSGNNIRG